MINRLTYEVRLKPIEKSARSIIHKKWRWDVVALKTTDPEYPGVETARHYLGGDFGYERWRWRALGRIADFIENNEYKKQYEEI